MMFNEKNLKKKKFRKNSDQSHVVTRMTSSRLQVGRHLFYPHFRPISHHLIQKTAKKSRDVTRRLLIGRRSFRATAVQFVAVFATHRTHTHTTHRHTRNTQKTLKKKNKRQTPSARRRRTRRRTIKKFVIFPETTTFTSTRTTFRRRNKGPGSSVVTATHHTTSGRGTRHDVFSVGSPNGGPQPENHQKRRH